MRVHPSQLSQGFFPIFGPSNFWVKSFNLNNKKIVLPICLLFLFSVIGSALNKEIIGNIKNKLSLIYSSSTVTEPLAVILSNTNSKILLLSAPIKPNARTDKSFFELSDLELSTTDRVLLDESRKLGSLSISSLSEASELPLLRLRSVIEIKELLNVHSSLTSDTSYQITSRVFIPGQSEIYGITNDGKVVEVQPNGTIIESAGD